MLPFEKKKFSLLLVFSNNAGQVVDFSLFCKLMKVLMNTLVPVSSFPKAIQCLICDAAVHLYVRIK